MKFKHAPLCDNLLGFLYRVQPSALALDKVLRPAVRRKEEGGHAPGRAVQLEQHAGYDAVHGRVGGVLLAHDEPVREQGFDGAHAQEDERHGEQQRVYLSVQRHAPDRERVVVEHERCGVERRAAPHFLVLDDACVCVEDGEQEEGEEQDPRREGGEKEHAHEVLVREDALHVLVRAGEAARVGAHEAQRVEEVREGRQREEGQQPHQREGVVEHEGHVKVEPEDLQLHGGVRIFKKEPGPRRRGRCVCTGGMKIFDTRQRRVAAAVHQIDKGYALKR